MYVEGYRFNNTCRIVGTCNDFAVIILEKRGSRIDQLTTARKESRRKQQLSTSFDAVFDTRTFLSRSGL